MDKNFVRTTVCRPFVRGGGVVLPFLAYTGMCRWMGSPRSQALSRSVETGGREPWERGWNRVWFLTSLCLETAYIISSESVLNRKNNFV